MLNSLGNEGSALDAENIADALEQVGDYRTASKTLLVGLTNTKTPSEYIDISRMLGQIGYYRNRSGEGDKYFDLAEHAFALEKFKKARVDQTETEYYNVETEAYWASVAALQKACNSAKPHIDKVKQYIGSPGGQAAQSNLTSLISAAQTACPSA